MNFATAEIDANSRPGEMLFLTIYLLFFYLARSMHKLASIIVQPVVVVKR